MRRLTARLVVAALTAVLACKMSDQPPDSEATLQSPSTAMGQSIESSERDCKPGIANMLCNHVRQEQTLVVAEDFSHRCRFDADCSPPGKCSSPHAHSEDQKCVIYCTSDAECPKEFLCYCSDRTLCGVRTDRAFEGTCVDLRDRRVLEEKLKTRGLPPSPNATED